MDDPSWAWPAWKFGMKKDDLFTTLHDKYNTLSVSLRDPEAFHHDVYELSNQAATADEFHSLMADRQQQRAREINESFESLAVEIIANPSLIGTEQWRHALQLFRTKSYDSIVRYYASYLPSDYLDGVPGVSSFSKTTPCCGAESSCTTTKPESAQDTPSYLDEDDYYPHGPAMTIKTNTRDLQGPLSPPHSENTPSETSDSMSYSSTRPPSPSMSYEGSESERFVLEHLSRDDETTSQSDYGETAVSSVCDSVESVSSLDSSEHSVHDKMTPQTVYSEDEYYDDDLPTTQFPEDFLDMDETLSSEPFNDTPESDTPTPRPMSGMTSYTDDKTVSTEAKNFAAAIKRSPSPKSQLRLRALGVPSTKSLRRSPEEAHSKVQKMRRETPADPSRRQTITKSQRGNGQGLLA